MKHHIIVDIFWGFGLQIVEICYYSLEVSEILPYLQQP